MRKKKNRDVPNPETQEAKRWYVPAKEMDPRARSRKIDLLEDQISNLILRLSDIASSGNENAGMALLHLLGLNFYACLGLSTREDEKGKWDHARFVRLAHELGGLVDVLNMHVDRDPGFAEAIRQHCQKIGRWPVVVDSVASPGRRNRKAKARPGCWEAARTLVENLDVGRTARAPQIRATPGTLAWDLRAWYLRVTQSQESGSKAVFWHQFGPRVGGWVSMRDMPPLTAASADEWADAFFSDLFMVGGNWRMWAKRLGSDARGEVLKLLRKWARVEQERVRRA